MDSVLELHAVSKRFPTHLAVDGVSLEIERGGLFALLGPSGCGKTTTLRMVAGFDQPTSGHVLLNGSPITHLAPYERNVNTVFQNYALFPHLSARDNIAFGLRRKGVREAEAGKRVREVLDLVQLGGKEDRMPARLSGGEKQRVALARALVMRPELLLLDEPLSALDPRLRKQVRSELKALQRSTGITFLIVTHDQEEALSMSDRIAVMHRGRLEQVGTPEDIYLRPCTRFVAGFLGAVNWIDGIGVRPEATRVSRDPPAGGARSVPATITGLVFLGNCLHIQSALPSGQSVTSEVSLRDADFQAGESVHLWWTSADELCLPPDPDS
jgi:ABC-type Fe3+/spermidine/putrescine transport system ATPase subunit